MTPEQRLRLERGDMIFAGRSRNELRRLVQNLEPGTYTVGREAGHNYVRLTDAEIKRLGVKRGTPIGGFTTAGFFKKGACT